MSKNTGPQTPIASGSQQATAQLTPGNAPAVAGVLVSRSPGAGPGMLNVAIKDKPTLYLSYMPFLRNGGLFIPIPNDLKLDNDFQMGSSVFILLSLMDDRIPVAGKVVWITPKHAEGNRAPGFGIQFDDLEGVANKKIEAILAGSQDFVRPTHTM